MMVKYLMFNPSITEKNTQVIEININKSSVYIKSNQIIAIHWMSKSFPNEINVKC